MSVVDGADDAFRTGGRVVIVGASLAGLRAAETLRAGGFTGAMTLVGDEPHEPYDRPPLSKQVLLGRADAYATLLPRACELKAEWRLGVAAEGLDLAGRQVRLARGEEIGFDRLLIATGTRARPWPEAGRGCPGRRLRGAHQRRFGRAAARAGRRAAPGPGHRCRVHRLRGRRGVPRAAHPGDRRGTGSDAAGRRPGRGDRRGGGAAAARARRGPALRRLRDGA